MLTQHGLALIKLLNKQMHANRTIYYVDKYTDAKPLMQSPNIPIKKFRTLT